VETQRFQAFLRIPSISSEGPKGVYQKAVDFLIEAFGDFPDSHKVYEFVPGKPVLVFQFLGSEPELPSILLNSHYDVVPADAASWKHPPFDGVKDADGNIFGRGTQDMKCVCMQYLESVRRIKEGVKKGTLKHQRRTIYLSYLPDEEVGGFDGAEYLVKSEHWKAMNIGLVLDEGLANPLNKFTVFYGERAPWWVKITSNGPVGHGSRFVKRTAIQKLSELLSNVYKFRAEQEEKLHGDGCKHASAKKLGDVITMNVTALKAGVEKGDGFCVNVIPAQAIAAIDIRIPPSVPMEEVENLLKQWTAEEGMSYEWYAKCPEHWVSSTEGKWWHCLKDTVEKFKEVEPEIFPAGTDSRFFRALGVPAYGFSPIANTPILLHDHNEFLNEKVFLEGIAIYEQLVYNLSNLD